MSVSHLHTRIEDVSFGYFSILNNLSNKDDSSRVSVHIVFIPIGTKCTYIEMVFSYLPVSSSKLQPH